jgi:hypothetical protein
MSRLRTARQTVIEVTPILSIGLLRERKANLQLIEKNSVYQKSKEQLRQNRAYELLCAKKITEFSDQCVARMSDGVETAVRLCANELFRQRLVEILESAKAKREVAQTKCREAKLALTLAQNLLFKLQEKNKELSCRAIAAGAALRENVAEMQIEEWSEMQVGRQNA